MTATTSTLRASWAADIRLALSFLTRLPVTAPDSLPANGLANAMRAFPVAGVVVGLIAGAAFWAAARLLTPTLAGLLAVFAQVLTTGGLHEDGLADTADGFGGRDRARRLEIMRDSRIGSYGVLALVLAVAIRASAIAAFAAVPLTGLLALVAAGTLSRAVMPLAMRLTPPARADGLGHGAGKPSPTTVGTALLLAALAAALCLPPAAAAMAFLVAIAVAFLGCSLAENRIGGYTGDVLGAIQQAVEVAVLLTAVAAA